MTVEVASTPATTLDDLLARARALAPVLAERAAETERLRQIPPATIADFVASGLLRIGNPVRFGGYGLEPDVLFDVAMELGRACGSAGWCYSVWGVHNWVAGHFPEQAQEEYFAGGPDAITSTSYNLQGAKAEPVEGGYRVSGRWEFSSGCDAAAWATLGAESPDGAIWIMVPRQEFTIVDTWHVLGLRGTGSKDVVVENAFVPAHRTVRVLSLGFSDTETLGWALHRRPSYRLPAMAILRPTLAAPAVGMAQGAVDAFFRRLQDRGGEPASGRLRLAEASAEVDAARTLLRQNCREILDRAGRGETFTPADSVRYHRDIAFVGRLCVQAVNRIFEASGGHSLHEANPIQRFFRDTHAATRHTALAWDTMAEQYGRVTLGLPAPGPR